MLPGAVSVIWKKSFMVFGRVRPWKLNTYTSQSSLYIGYNCMGKQSIISLRRVTHNKMYSLTRNLFIIQSQVRVDERQFSPQMTGWRLYTATVLRRIVHDSIPFRLR
jgi:hypothetical protein